MERNRKCPKCGKKIFRIIESDNGKVEVRCHECASVYFGMEPKRVNELNTAVKNALPAMPGEEQEVNA